MAKTAAERQRDRRLRVKLNPTLHREHKRIDRERKRSRRAMMSVAEIKDLRIKNKRAVDTFRKRANSSDDNQLTELQALNRVYRTPAALGKARRRVIRALPQSPRKKAAIVKTIACEILDAYIQEKPRPASSISHETEQSVLHFYEDDEISRMAPGKAEFVTIKSDNKKQRVQKRYLYNTIDETYRLFLQDNEDVKIGRTAFAYLRPKWVQLTSKMPRNTCGCLYHSNVILLLECLHSKCPDVFPLYSRENFLSKCVCNIENQDCCMGACNTCADGKLYDEHFSKKVPHDIVYLSWYEWLQDEEGYMKKTKREGSIQAAVVELKNKLPKFVWHTFIKEHQARSYRDQKSLASDPNGDVALLQMDFAENYTCQYQDEIQSAHWKQSQVTVYTVIGQHRGHVINYIIASDSRGHDKEAVTAFTERSLEIIKSKFATAKRVNIWTDGPSSQFKNKFIFAILPKLQSKFEIELSWKYFATSHGKGPNDALGGNAKRLVSRKVNSRAFVVTDAVTFAAAVDACQSSITTEVMNDPSINHRLQTLGVRKIWDNLKPFTGTQSIHSVEVYNSTALVTKFYDSSFDKTVKNIQYAHEKRSTDAVETPGSSCTASTTSVIGTKSNRAIRRKLYICPGCNWCFGDPQDPLLSEDWVKCKICKVWYHLSCAEDNGIIEDDGGFLCAKCL